MFKKILFIFISIWFSVASSSFVFAADDVVLSDLRFRSTPPVVNLANRLYLTFRNTSSSDRTRVINVSYNLNGTSYNFGSSQIADILANSSASVFIDDTVRLRGNVQFVIDLYSEQASICSTIPVSSKVATYFQTAFIDGDNDGDTIPDSIDPDDDNDGLPDVDEVRIGTDPFNPDTDRDGQKDGVDPCPLDFLNTCVTPTLTPTPTIAPTAIVNSPTPTSGGSSNSQTSNVVNNNTQNTNTNIITQAIQNIFADVGRNVGLIENEDETIIDPTILGETIIPQVAGVTDSFSICLECKVWPVIFGMLIITAVFVWLVKSGAGDSQQKWWWLAGLGIPVLGYILFILINRSCIQPQIIFASNYFWCKWFTFVDFGIYGFGVLITKLIAKNKE